MTSLSTISPRGLDVVSFGEALIDLIEDGGTYTAHLGGAPTNVAIVAAKLGARVGLISAVGNDRFGKFIIDQLKEHKVDYRGVRCHRKRGTSLAFIFPNEAENSKRFIFYRDADLYFGHEQIKSVLSPLPSVFYFGSLSLTDRNVLSTLKNTQKIYNHQGIVVFDLNIRETLWPSKQVLRKTLLDAIKQADIIKADKHEAFLMSGHLDPERASESLLYNNSQICLITMGEEGCFYRVNDISGFVASIRIDTSKGDKVGTGDAFVGALCANIAKNVNYFRQDILEHILLRANVAGAITATVRGAIAQNLDNETVDYILLQMEKS